MLEGKISLDKTVDLTCEAYCATSARGIPSRARTNYENYARYLTLLLAGLPARPVAFLPHSLVVTSTMSTAAARYDFEEGEGAAASIWLRPPRHQSNDARHRSETLGNRIKIFKVVVRVRT